ncbi:hypothetical protein ACIQVR_30045 [Streptomyces xanthochromogenes]|uniref:hypothetical protein n=1 Tax=Streptomyces xanthochromogenes TaxID=67384 RepID=UPI0038078565
MSSADHLFVKQDLARWAQHGAIQAQTRLRNLGTGSGDAVEFTARNSGQRLRFQFSRLDHGAWKDARAELADAGVAMDWVFGLNAAHPEIVEESYDELGHLLRFHCYTDGASRRLRIGAELPDRSIDWVRLESCRMSSEGLRILGVQRRLKPHASGKEQGEAGTVSVIAPPAPSSRAETVKALREALENCAQLRTRPTWYTLCRAASLDTSALTVDDCVDLLISVDEDVPRTHRPVLAALIRAHDGGPLPHLGHIAEAIGLGRPTSEPLLRRWAQREIDRAYAVYGSPSRKPPERIPLDGSPSGTAVSGAARPRTIVHVAAGPVHRQSLPGMSPKRKAKTQPTQGSVESLVRDLRAARIEGQSQRATKLLTKVLPRLARTLGGQELRRLKSEAARTRRWLESTKEQKRAARTRSTRKK